MNHLLEYENLNESVNWRQGGWVLIKGTQQKEDKCYLFAARIKNVLTFPRKKADGTPGVPVNMAALYPEFFGIGLSDGKLAAKEIGELSPEYMKKWISITSPNVGLNYHKTVAWKETIAEISLGKVLSDQSWLIKAPWIKLPDIKP
jgi:hypothetical protein